MREQTFTLSDSASESLPAERAAFIRRTYTHLAVALLLFTGLEFYMVNSPFAEELAISMTGGMSWLLVLALSWRSYIANKLALSGSSVQMQYLGLGLFIIAEDIVFLPLLFIASNYVGGIDLIPTAGLMTLLLVTGITATVFITKKDFSFMSGILSVGAFVALGFIVCSIIFGFSLGLIFSAVMILFAGGSVLYTTSNILHEFRTDQHVAASLSLFASVALLFFYIVQFLMHNAGGGND